MSTLKLNGVTSGSSIIKAPDTGSTGQIFTMPASTGTLATTADTTGGANGVDFNDNVKARFGTGNDLEIYHDGSHSIIKDAGDGELQLITNGTKISLKTAEGDTLAAFNRDGDSSLRYDGSKKIATTATGINVTGAIAGATNLGKVLQVVSDTNTAQQSTSSTSFQNSNCSIAITPSSTSSKILILFNIGTLYVSATGYAWGTVFRGDNTGTNLGYGDTGFGGVHADNGNGGHASVSGSYLDSPNTTSATTYTLGWRSSSSSYTAYFSGGGSKSVITLVEIAG